MGHTFKPMTSNRTRCDICGRTAGVPTHNEEKVTRVMSADERREWIEAEMRRAAR